MTMIPVALKIVDESFVNQFGRPGYATRGSAAVDIRANVCSTITLHPGDVALVGTGIAVHIADKSFAASILPRSGLGHKSGIVLGNGTGLIDSDYQGEIKVSVFNRGTEPFTIHRGDRIAQMYFHPVVMAYFFEVDSFENETVRGEGGFGHSGVK